MSVIVKDLLKIYGEQRAVNSISFSIEKGEIVGFLGPNGAGKSTTMKMITGFLSPDGGAITVAETDVMIDPIAAQKKIGYLPESNALYYDMYVREYLDFIADVHSLKNKKDAVERVIQLTGLTPESKKKVGQLSKGYKQRVGLAAALIHDPEVLILDEPTSGLDPNQIVEIRQVIKNQGKDKIVLFSSHIMQEVEAICDRVIIINRGNLVADDKLENLQQQSNASTVKVKFKETLEAEWLQRLKAVIKVDKAEDKTWLLETTEPDVVRREVMQLAAEQNFDIISLDTQSKSLEEIFRSLTAGAKKEA